MAKRPAKTDPPTTPEPTVYPTGSQQKASTSMSELSFSDILDAPIDDIEAPKPTPEGSYLCTIDGPHEEGKSSQQQTPFVRFKMKILSPMEDVDPEAFAEAKAQGKTLLGTFYLTEGAAFRLKEFLLGPCGITPNTIRIMLSEAPGRQVIAYVKHGLTQPKDGSEPRVRVEVDRYAAA